MIWLLYRVLKVDFCVAYLISLFYILNPFFIYHVHSFMFWNAAPLFVFPFIFGLIYKYYFNIGRLFLFFGLITALLSFSLSNIPYLGVFQILLLISIVFASFIRDVRVDLKKVIKIFLILESSFILFNAWWLINLVRFTVQDIATYFPKDFAIGWATSYLTGDNSMIMKLLSLTARIVKEDINFFSDFYLSTPFYIILFIPLFLIIVNFFKKEDFKYKKYTLITLSLILIVIFLNKGANAPFGEIYIWMLENIPFFYIFKTPLEKFSPLFLLLVSLALIPVFKGKTKKLAFFLLPIYLIACSIPYLSLNFSPDYTFAVDKDRKPLKFISKKYNYKESYFSAIQTINKNKLDYKYLSTPGSRNYQETILNHDGNKYYRGMNPFLHATNKPFIAAYSGVIIDFFYPIFQNFSNNTVLEGLSDIYGIKKIVLNQDIQGAFGFVEGENKAQLFQIFSREYTKQEFGPITIFTRKKYLPHFYTTKTIISSLDSQEQLTDFFDKQGYQTRSVFYFQNENGSRENDRIKNLKIKKLPIIEYKKINPIKYRIIIHQAEGEFPLIFSEGFHEGWKMYSANSQMQLALDDLKSYKILDGNEEDQANYDELKEYINDGLITTLGDGKEKIIKHQRLKNGKVETKYIEKYIIDFISEDFEGTIQNNNLPMGGIYETWLKTPIENNKNHIKANGYANSWLVNVNSICQKRPHCKKNQDGTFDFEVVIEFWPERLLYLGLYISIATFLIYLGATVGKRKK